MIRKAIALCIIAMLVVGTATLVFCPLERELFGMGLALIFGIAALALICHDDARTRGG